MLIENAGVEVKDFQPAVVAFLFPLLSMFDGFQFSLSNNLYLFHRADALNVPPQLQWAACSLLPPPSSLSKDLSFPISPLWYDSEFDLDQAGVYKTSRAEEK